MKPMSARIALLGLSLLVGANAEAATWVYDGGTFPNTPKSDYISQPSVPDNQKVVADEVNARDQFEYDLRTALLAGYFHGFASVASPPPAPVSGVIVFVLNGVLSSEDSAANVRAIGTAFFLDGGAGLIYTLSPIVQMPSLDAGNVNTGTLSAAGMVSAGSLDAGNVNAASVTVAGKVSASGADMDGGPITNVGLGQTSTSAANVGQILGLLSVSGSTPAAWFSTSPFAAQKAFGSMTTPVGRLTVVQNSGGVCSGSECSGSVTYGVVDLSNSGAVLCSVSVLACCHTISAACPTITGIPTATNCSFFADGGSVIGLEVLDGGNCDGGYGQANVNFFGY